MKCVILKVSAFVFLLAIASGVSASDESAASPQSLRGSFLDEGEDFGAPRSARGRTDGPFGALATCTENCRCPSGFKYCDMNRCERNCECPGGRCKMKRCKRNCSSLSGTRMNRCETNCNCAIGRCQMTSCRKKCKCGRRNNCVTGEYDFEGNSDSASFEYDSEDFDEEEEAQDSEDFDFEDSEDEDEDIDEEEEDITFAQA